MLDPAKNLVTSFQLKSARSSEILQKNSYFRSDSNQLVKSHVNVLSCVHYHWTRVEYGRFGHHAFRPTIFPVDVLSNVTWHKCSLPYLLFACHTVLTIFSKWPHVFITYTVEQCSAINRLCIVSTSTNILSMVFVIQNCAIHIWEHTKGSLTLSGCFLLPACL